MNSLKKIKYVGKKLLLVSCLLLVFTFAGARAFNSSSQIAYAATIDNLPFVIADYDASNVVDRAAGAGTTNQAKGNANEAAGVVKRNFGDLGDQTEGTAQKAKGKVQQGVGKLQEGAEKSASELEDSTDNLLDSVKNFFQGE